jgi:hypothetical protein
MAAAFEPGVWSQHDDLCSVDDGTLPRSPASRPGPVCALPTAAPVRDARVHPPRALLLRATAQAPLSGLQLRSAIVRVAQEEWRRWNKPHKLHERDPVARAMLEVYWRVGVNWRVGDEQLANKVWQNAHPWSAAFICYVLRMAGAAHQFKYAAAHADYIRWAIDNKLEKRNAPFWGYRMNKAVPEPGDLLGKSRSGSTANYDTIQDGGYFATHCDIVTEVRGKQLVTIGGNVSDSVTQTLVPLDKDGFVSLPNYFVVIKTEGQVKDAAR